MSDPQIVSLVLEWPQPVIASVVIERGPRGLPGEAGEDGREIELQAGVTHIQWRYAGETGWTNLVAIEDLRGDPGEPGEPGIGLPDGWSVASIDPATGIFLLTHPIHGDREMIMTTPVEA